MHRSLSLVLGMIIIAWQSSPAAAIEETFLGLRPAEQPDKTRIIGGLGWRATVEDKGVRLGRRAHVCFEEALEGMGWRVHAGADWADIGLVRPDAPKLTGEGTVSSWATAETSFTYEEDGKPQRFKVYVTRLSPAVIVELTGTRLRLFEGAKVFPFGKNDADWAPADRRISGPPPVPKCFATAGGVASCEQLASAQSGDWLLAWYGAESRIVAEADVGHRTLSVDCPVLMVFGAPPAKLAAGPDGMAITFTAEGPKRLAVLPLLGERLPRAVQDEKPKVYPSFVGAFRANHQPQFADLAATETWKDGLPRSIVQQCQWWAERLKETPVGVRETYRYDQEADRMAVRGTIEFLKLGAGGKRFAPLPPMLAVASRKRLRLLQVEGNPVSSPLTTKWGPYIGMEDAGEYAYSVSGLGKYALEVRAVKSGAEPPEVRKALDEELAKVSEAGILAPWYPILAVGGFGGRASRAHNEGHRLLWGIPGENLYYIGQCLDLASAEQRARLTELAKAWQAKYPSEKVPHMPAAKDALREHYLATIYRLREWPMRERNFHFLNNVLPCESEYYLADYYRYMGQKPMGLPTVLDPYLARSDWASLGLLRAEKGHKKDPRWHQDVYDRDYGKGGVDDVNRLLSGLIGRVRLAKMLGADPDVERGMYFLARTAILRFALEQWKYVLHEDKFLALRPPEAPPRSFFGTGLHTFNRKTAGDDPLVVAEMDEFFLTMRDCYVHVHWHPHRLVAYLNMIPELGRFLQDHLKAEVGDYVRIVEESNPEWYTPYADCTLSFETYSLHPADSYQVFLARAWVTGDPPQKLWKYADQPWVGRGDWFYIHKVAETLRAYRGVCWEKIKE